MYLIQKTATRFYLFYDRWCVIINFTDDIKVLDVMGKFGKATISFFISARLSDRSSVLMQRIASHGKDLQQV